MLNFLLDYALTAPDTICHRVEQETKGNCMASWEDVDEECFIIKIISIKIPVEWEKKNIEELLYPYLFQD